MYLPETPTSSPEDVATAASGLTTALAKVLPALALEPKIFRNGADAGAYLRERGNEIALLLVDPIVLLDLPPSLTVEPVWSFLRGREDSRRRVVAVRSDGPRSLLELRERTLSMALPLGPHGDRYLARAVFQGDLEPASWFGHLEGASDDVSALANLLYGRADAVLVAADAPQLSGANLRIVYTSPPLPMPVLAARTGVLDGEARRALATAAASLGQQPGGRASLGALRFDNATAAGVTALAGNLDGPTPGSALLSRLAPAVADPARVGVSLPPRPTASELAFLLGLELPEVPLPGELPAGSDGGLLQAQLP